MSAPHAGPTPARSHTPGPWRVGDAGHTIFGPPTGAPSPRMVATVKWRADAPLLAAAPSLLAALERITEWERDPDRFGGDLADMLVECRAAIAAAKGETK